MGCYGVVYSDANSQEHAVLFYARIPTRARVRLPWCAVCKGSSSRVTLEGKDTGDFAWSLSNTTKRMTLVLSGRGRFPRRGEFGDVVSTVSLRQSFRIF